MTIQPSPYEILRAIQDQQRATDRLVQVLMGMLDASAPDPFLMSGPPAQSPASPSAPPTMRRISEEAARPASVIDIDGIQVTTTKRRARLLATLVEGPQTLSAMSRLGISPTVAGMKAQIRDTNADLERAGVVRRVRMQALPAQRRGAKGGREPALYALLNPKFTNADPEVPPSVQSEAEAGLSPEEEASACAVGEGDKIVAAHDAPFVTPADAGEGPASPADPVPAADAPLPEPPEAPKRKPLTIGLGMLIGVDLVACHVSGPAGDYKISGQKMAKTLDMLRGGLMFGLDIVAKRCAWQSAEVARSALLLERERLAGIGIDMHLDKQNVRLRVAAE